MIALAPSPRRLQQLPHPLAFRRPAAAFTPARPATGGDAARLPRPDIVPRGRGSTKSVVIDAAICPLGEAVCVGAAPSVVLDAAADPAQLAPKTRSARPLAENHAAGRHPRR